MPVRFTRSVGILTTLTVGLIFALFLTGCDLLKDLGIELPGDSEPTHCAAGRSTAEYFEDAIQFSPAGQRWVFHNWLSDSPDSGCHIIINVLDLDQPTSVRTAVENGLRAWRNEIDRTGIACVIDTRFESLEEPLSTEEPRMQIEFVELLDGNRRGGLTTVSFERPSRTFSHVRIQIASTIANDGDTVTLSEPDRGRAILHELGHALGIFGYDGATGHSTDEEDVMFVRGECTSLSEGDAATMRETYTRTPYFRPSASGDASRVETTEVSCGQHAPIESMPVQRRPL